VFAQEPAKENALFGMENVVCTPHLGASTTEAQVNVALQVAEQMADYLTSGAITNALNMPSISAEDAPKLKPYMKLAEQLGSFTGQISESAIKSIKVEYFGSVAEINTKPLTLIAVSSLLKPLMESVNMVNALSIAESRGIAVSETQTVASNDWRSAIRITVETETQTRAVTGSLFTGKEPRLVEVEGVRCEAALCGHMLFIRNQDKPGLIGSVGTLLGNAGQNIADFRLGRQENEGRAIALISLDAALPDDLLTEISNLPQIQSIKRLAF